MKLTRSFLAIAICFSLSLFTFLTLPVHKVTAQDGTVALQRGYRTGYSDGYMAGYRDSIDGTTKSYTRHTEYSDANRAYNRDYGTIEDYRDGYQQGFESGYNVGFEKRSFESTVPTDLHLRGAVASNPPIEPAITTPTAETSAPPADATAPTQAPAPETMQKISFQPTSDAVIIIPRDTELILELQDELTTESGREGDKFTAKVISPAEITGAMIEGRIEKVQKPGRIKRRSQMLLSFDRIVLSETRWSNFDGILMEVLPVKGDNVKRVDNEGSAVGKSSYKDDAIKLGATTGTGAGIGAIAGGPVGAAVGAGVGAAFGVGAVVIERGKNIKLNRSQQLRIKSSYETQIR
jgi:hypothetical protein